MSYSVDGGVWREFEYLVWNSIKPRGLGDREAVHRFDDEQTVEGKGGRWPFFWEVIFGQIERVVTLRECPWRGACRESRGEFGLETRLNSILDVVRVEV